MSDFIYLPILINPHCHGRDFEEAHKTTVLQVLRESKISLISITAFMPNTNPPIINSLMRKRMTDKIKAAQKELGLFYPQYYFFGAEENGEENNLVECQLAALDPLVIGFKIFLKEKNLFTTTGKIGLINDATIQKVMQIAARCGKPVAIHCSEPALFTKQGDSIQAEFYAVRRIINLAREIPGLKLAICHVSCIQSANLILATQKQGLAVALEIAPHYLWFDSQGTNWNPKADPLYYHCYNNLRRPEHREYLQCLAREENPLVYIAADSACHTREEKIQQGLGGIPSHQEMVPALITLGRQIGIADEQLANLLSFNASRFYNIPISPKLKKYSLEKRINKLLYNEGKVFNPWNGLRMLFPIKP